MNESIYSAAATVHDLKQEKKAHRELHKHKDLFEQKKQYMEHGNILHYNPMIEANIALLGFHSKFLSAYKNGKIEVKADEIGTNEILTAVPITKGMDNDNRCKVFLKLNGCDLYLSAAKNGKLEIKEWARNYEKWVVEKDEKTGMFAFKSYHGKYLCAEKGGIPKADRKNKKDWEKWRVVVVQNANSKETTTNDLQKEEMVQNEGSYY